MLTSVGIPVCVKFRFHIEDMYDYQFKEIVLSFIKKIAYKILESKKFYIIKKPGNPSRLLTYPVAPELFALYAIPVVFP